MYLENADEKKYGSLCKTLNTQYALGNDQFPVTIPEATHIKRIKMDNARDFSKNRNRSNKKKPENTLNILFAQMNGLCYCCGKKGHLSTDCRYKNKPKSEWFPRFVSHSKNELSQELSDHIRRCEDYEKYFRTRYRCVKKGSQSDENQSNL